MKLLFILSWILGLQPLHDAGFKGEGMTIAVIDCGFYGADSASFFPQDQIVGFYDLIEDEYRTYGMTESEFDNHGTLCMSVMFYDGEDFTGTAPKANYILLRTEELSDEHRRDVDRLALPSAMLAAADRAAIVIWSNNRPHGSLCRVRCRNPNSRTANSTTAARIHESSQ